MRISTMHWRWLPLTAMLCLLLAEPSVAVGLLEFSRVDSYLGVDMVIMTYGPSWGDYSGDGLDDLFSGNHYSAQPNLFRNAPGQFVDEWQTAGISQSGDRHSAVWGDYNNDGLLDLYVSCGGADENQLYMNDNGSHFTDVASSSGTLDFDGRGRFVYWIDVDNDGWLDLFVGNLATTNSLYMNQQDGTFLPEPGAGGLDETLLWYAAWTQLDDDDYMDVVMASDWGQKFALFMNAGDGTFEDHTIGSGLPSTISAGRGLCWIDYDNDGDQDLYLSRGYGSGLRDAIWWSTDTHMFHMFMEDNSEDESGLDGVTIYTDGDTLEFNVQMNHDTPLGDVYLGIGGASPGSNPFQVVNGDYLGQPSFTPGVDFGCYIWQDAIDGPWQVRCCTDYGDRYKFGGIVEPIDGTITDVDTVGIEDPVSPISTSDIFYRNQGDGTFVDLTSQAGISNDLSSNTVIAADFDNDGWQDLYVVNERNTSGYIAQNQPNCLYVNNGNGTFTDKALDSGADCQVAGTGAGAAWSDFDDDGFLDLYVTNGWENFPFHLGPHVVYRNEGNANNWIKIRLIGDTTNRDGIGARVRIVADGRAQYRVQTGSVNDMSQSSMVIHFGLGTAAIVDSLTISWPLNGNQTFTDLAVNQTYEITEWSSNIHLEIQSSEERFALRPAVVNPTRSGTAISYRLPVSSEMSIELYDMTGRKLRTLFQGRQRSGEHTIKWNGRDASGRRVAPGVYYARLATGNREAGCEIVLFR